MVDYKKIANECFVKFGYKSIVPISVNGRLSKTLGRCYYNSQSGNVKPTRIELSAKILSCPDNEAINVIKHECAHAIAMLDDGKAHGHDATFKAVCARLECDYDEPSADTSVKYRYNLFCPTCKKVIYGSDRRVNAIKYPERYRCGICHSAVVVAEG